MNPSSEAKASLEVLEPHFELPLAVMPTEYRLDQQFDFSTEACLGQTHPVVAFRGPHAPSLALRLFFDADLSEKTDLKKVEQFVEKVRTVQAESKSVPEVKFRAGGFQFRGYVQRFSFRPTRFTGNGDPAAAELDLTLLGSGEK